MNRRYTENILLQLKQLSVNKYIFDISRGPTSMHVFLAYLCFLSEQQAQNNLSLALHGKK